MNDFQKNLAVLIVSATALALPPVTTVALTSKAEFREDHPANRHQRIADFRAFICSVSDANLYCEPRAVVKTDRLQIRASFLRHCALENNP
jgi:hypothetical protein